MTATQYQPQITLVSRLVNGILGIKPVFDLARYQARTMMINRAEKMGVAWRENVKKLKKHDWATELKAVENADLTYPDYYVCSFHAYEKGNLDWDAALEVESAAYAVHSTIWPGAGTDGDPRLRRNYHQVLTQELSISPRRILDLGCSVGMSTFALQDTYPSAAITGLDLSPYYLAVANYNSRQQNRRVDWVHSLAESTGLETGSFDLVSSFLMFHELPQSASVEILEEARRLLGPGGYFTMMDMNPRSQIYQKMPPYILTLLKSTEPYLDQYFTLDMERVLIEAGFQAPKIIPISPRHRAIIAQVQ